MADPADVNPFRMSLEELARSTGHAPGEALVEMEPEVEQHYEPPRPRPAPVIVGGLHHL